MKDVTHRRIAAWMLVPAILVVPAFISGISIWNSWSPHWLLISIAVTAALLALLIDYRRAVRWALVGILLGAATSPVLLLFPHADKALFAWWTIAVALLTAFLVPLMAGSPQPRSQLPAPQMSQPDDGELGMEHLLSAAPPQSKV
jgi:hypothetical protein